MSTGPEGNFVVPEHPTGMARQQLSIDFMLCRL